MDLHNAAVGDAQDPGLGKMESSHLLSGGGISSCCIGGNGEPKSPPPPASVASGLGILTAAVFLVGELAGTGLLAMPKAVLNSGKMRDEKYDAGTTIPFS